MIIKKKTFKSEKKIKIIKQVRDQEKQNQTSPMCLTSTTYVVDKKITGSEFFKSTNGKL